MTRGILSTPASDVAYLVCYKLNFILYTQWTKKQFKTSQVDTILSALAVKVNKIQDAAYIFPHELTFYNFDQSEHENWT